ncbi:GNAT family N-acetyltransferase [Halobacteria archaeon AArc-dxtr1]|nr:GNAT family N-acetyltransferase [Halobacteria archaeon AArc-dxtr1]
MDIRNATEEDLASIRTVARRSLHSLYTEFLGEDTVEEGIDQWYGDGAADEIADDHALFVVVERDGEIIAFSQSELVGQRYGTGQILWLHVDPDHRGSGLGVRLLVRTRERLLEAGADHILGFVLAGNDAGNAFYREHGFEQASQRDVEIGAKTFTENVYVEGGLNGGSWEATDDLTIDGQNRIVSYGEVTRGSQSPFYAVYEGPDRDRRYGWLCGNCDSVDNAMDAMGRIECNTCGNRRKATRWDASYL